MDSSSSPSFDSASYSAEYGTGVSTVDATRIGGKRRLRRSRRAGQRISSRSGEKKNSRKSKKSGKSRKMRKTHRRR